MTRKVNWLLGLGVLLLLILSLIGGWVAVLTSSDLPNRRLATFLPWPVACSSRGCVNMRDWEKQQQIANQFATHTKATAPSAEVTLTTAVRRHLLAHAFVTTPVTSTDARRYREEILHLKDEQKIVDISGLSPEDYDMLVVLPFLQQAALQQEHKAESVDELYKELARDRLVLVLPFHYRWANDTGRVVAK